MSTSMSLGVSSRISSSSEPSTTVGHVPREISKLCCACLGRKEEGSLALTGPRHCSTITEGGLDVPCSLSFEGPPELLKKFNKVVNALFLFCTCPALFCLCLVACELHADRETETVGGQVNGGGRLACIETKKGVGAYPVHGRLR